MGPGRGGDGGPRPLRLPALIHIMHARSVVSVADSAGAVIEEITTIAAPADTLSHAPGAQVLRGAWKDGRLEAQVPGPRGGKATQTLGLEDGGRTLVIHTRLEAVGDMPARDIRRVYRKAGD